MHEGAERHALGHGGDIGAAHEGPVPPQPLARGARPEAHLEGHAPEDQGQQHDGQGDVEGGEQDGVGQREHREQPAAAQHQPGLVAVPDRGDGVDHQVALLRAMDGWEQDADPQVEPVQRHIGEDGDRDQQRPDQRQVEAHSPASTSSGVGRAPKVSGVPMIEGAAVRPAVRTG